MRITINIPDGMIEKLKDISLEKSNLNRMKTTIGDICLESVIQKYNLTTDGHFTNDTCKHYIVYSQTEVDKILEDLGNPPIVNVYFDADKIAKLLQTKIDDVIHHIEYRLFTKQNIKTNTTYIKDMDAWYHMLKGFASESKFELYPVNLPAKLEYGFLVLPLMKMYVIKINDLKSVMNKYNDIIALREPYMNGIK